MIVAGRRLSIYLLTVYFLSVVAAGTVLAHPGGHQLTAVTTSPPRNPPDRRRRPSVLRYRYGSYDNSGEAVLDDDELETNNNDVLVLPDARTLPTGGRTDSDGDDVLQTMDDDSSSERRVDVGLPTDWVDPVGPSAGNDTLKSRLPQAIIIGVKKGGTRALLEFLRIHPDVRAPGPEVHFFDRHYDRGLDWYRSQMPPTSSGQVTIEKTPSYFVTKSAPERVANMSADVRLIIVVRDPVTRAISDYAQVAAKRPGMPSFEQMAFLDDNLTSTGLRGPVATSWAGIKIGIYARHLARWLRHFPLEQIHFVHGERLINDPAGEVALLQDFLGLRRFITEKHFHFDAAKGFPCLRKTDGTGDSVHCLGKTKGRTHPVVNPKALQRLRDFFRPFNEKFYRMTGLNFGWP